MAIRGNQWQSEAMNDTRLRANAECEAIRGNQRPSEAMNDTHLRAYAEQ